MLSIKQRFEKTKEENPNCSTFVNFCSAVEGSKIGKSSISKWFKKLVDKDDYDKGCYRTLLRWVASKTPSCIHKKRGKRALGEKIKVKPSKVA